MSARHVVLLTYGEPPAPDFMAQLVYSWRILLGLTRSVAPIPGWALPGIALSRAVMRARLWGRERYGSPLEAITREQAQRLAEALGEGGALPWRVHVAYEFRDPLLRQVLARIPGDEAVDVVPMYAADSAFTHALSRAALANALVGLARGAPARVVPALGAEILAELSARHVMRETEARNSHGPDWGLVLAAHGTLLEPPKPIETGRVATEQVAAAITRRLGGRFGAISLGWLNHVYGGRWTEPPADRALRRLVDSGYRRVVYFPFGFLADNAESELEGRLALRLTPELEAVHLPCLNAAPELAGALADGVARENSQQVSMGRTVVAPCEPPLKR